jgi:hypothetical protein
MRVTQANGQTSKQAIISWFAKMLFLWTHKAPALESTTKQEHALPKELQHSTPSKLKHQDKTQLNKQEWPFKEGLN